MTGPACGNNPNHKLTDGDRQAVDSFRAYLATLTSLRTAYHQLDQIRDAARLHRQQLVGTSELYAVIEADDAPPADEPAPGSVREQLLSAIDSTRVPPLGYPSKAALLAAYDAAVVPATTRHDTDRRTVLREAADRLAAGPVHCPLCPTPLTLHTPSGARAHFTAVHPEWSITGRDAGPWPLLVADETAATETPAVDERHDDTSPVKEATRRYAEQLRNQPGTASADGHTGWECDAGASLLVGAHTPGPGTLGTHHGAIYACAAHQEAAAVRIVRAGYEADPRPAPPGHRWDPWPCGHVTAYCPDALSALTVTDEPAAGAGQDGGAV